MLIRQTLRFLPAQIIGPLFMFIAAVVWTHWLSPRAYGIFTFIVAGQDFAFLITLSWWSQFMMRHYGGVADEAARRSYQATENSVLLLSALAQALMALIALHLLHLDLSPVLVSIAIGYYLTRNITHHLTDRARNAGLAAAYTFGQLMGPVAGFVLALALVAGTSATPLAALAGFTMAQSLGMVGLWWLLKLPLARPALDTKLLAKAALYGLPLVPAGALGWISINGIRLVVEHARGTAAVGLVAVGWGLGQRLASIVAMLVTVAAYPLAVARLQQGGRADGMAQVARNGLLLIGLVLPAIAGIIMLDHELVALLIAPAYQPITLAILPLAAVAGGLTNIRVHVSNQAYLLCQRTDLVVVVNALEAVLVVTFCAIGLALGGLQAAVAGCATGSALALLGGFAISQRRFGLVLDGAVLLRLVLATSFMALMLAPLLWHHAPHNLALRLALKMLVGVLAYALALGVLFPGERVRALGELRNHFRLKPQPH